MTIFIKENTKAAKFAAFCMQTETIAITFGYSIHLYGATTDVFIANKEWLCHEVMHVHQYKKEGYINFIFKYALELLKKGYFNNKFEVEARKHEHDYALLENLNIITQ